ncbi:MAG: 16S rRNA (guanine(527)-N(7))-methyltransferase RsmG [Bacteroidota bacterium]
MNNNSKILFHNLLKRNRKNITDHQLGQLAYYEELLSNWNKKINLVSRKDEENIWSRQIIGSISFLFQYELESKSRMVDVGTGGGLPGIPLAILYPESLITLIDSIQKKVNAVEDMVQSLQLKNVKCYCGRAEELSRKDELHESFDYVISRAVAPIRDIMKWCKPFLKQHEIKDCATNNLIQRGSFIFLKGGDLADELSAAQVKFKPRDIQNYELPLIAEIPELTDKRIILIKP